MINTPDHLGSSSYITDANGEVSQHLEYFAFGETFVEEHSNKDRTPYLYNAKELDEETGLYYYGARYYDPVTSVWQSVDPLVLNTHYLDGKVNGGVFASLNLGVYSYTWNNPLKYIDPDGRSIVNPRKMVLSNKTLIRKLKAFDRAVSRISGRKVSSYKFVISGGDRYKKNGKIYSATNHGHITKSAKRSQHIRGEGATGVDLKMAKGISYEVIKKAAKETGFRLDPAGKYNDHFHLDLKGSDIDMEYNGNDYTPKDSDFEQPAKRPFGERLKNFNRKLKLFNKRLEKINARLEKRIEKNNK